MSHIPKYPHEAAFPQPHLFKLAPHEQPNVLLPAQWGLSKRELFAAMAMQGAMSADAPFKSQQECAALSVAFADALIDALQTPERN